MLNYKNVSRVALHHVKEFSTNCHWTGYLFMEYMTKKGINRLFKMGEQHFLTGSTGWQGEEGNPEISSKRFIFSNGPLSAL